MCIDSVGCGTVTKILASQCAVVNGNDVECSWGGTAW